MTSQELHTTGIKGAYRKITLPDGSIVLKSASYSEFAGYMATQEGFSTIQEYEDWLRTAYDEEG